MHIHRIFSIPGGLLRPVLIVCMLRPGCCIKSNGPCVHKLFVFLGKDLQ